MSESPLHRWARRKAESHASQKAPAAAPGLEEAPEPVEKRSAGGADVPRLADVESLTVESDFSVFMAPGVPGAVRAAALRRLWQLEPSLSVPDGLVEYGEDFVSRPTGQLVRTAFRIGRGMAPLAPEDEHRDAEDAEPGMTEAQANQEGEGTV